MSNETSAQKENDCFYDAADIREELAVAFEELSALCTRYDIPMLITAAVANSAEETTYLTASVVPKTHRASSDKLDKLKKITESNWRAAHPDAVIFDELPIIT